MEKRRLGRTDIEVSLICLGTMTWGQQNTQADGFAQMDYAVEHGINFFDTAELYAIPPTPETRGMTEKIIGHWFANTGKREQIILATKIAGKGASFPERCFDRGNIDEAIEGSLRRLQTDYIDLYQLHWPERRVNSFGRLDFPSDAEIRANEVDLMHNTLRILKGHIDKGNIRYIGLSNETPWGVMTFLRLAEEYNLPRVVSVQNPYSLLNRTFEIGLSEFSLQEDCGLLAYSPLAGGTLTGKYLNGEVPKGSRRSLDNRGSRYERPHENKVVRAYLDIANDNGLDVSQMALSFVNQQHFVTSTIIGATTMEQLKLNIASKEIKLSDDVVNAINEAHMDQPNPCP